MSNRIFKLLIEDLAQRGREHHHQLMMPEKIEATAAFIKEMPFSEKSSLLCDADRSTELPDLVAAVIESNKSEKSKSDLANKLFEIFVTGNQHYENYFANAIDLALEDEHAFTQDPLGYLDDIAAQDATERANDMKKAV